MAVQVNQQQVSYAAILIDQSFRLNATKSNTEVVTDSVAQDLFSPSSLQPTRFEDEVMDDDETVSSSSSSTSSSPITLPDRTRDFEPMDCALDLTDNSDIDSDIDVLDPNFEGIISPINQQFSDSEQVSSSPVFESSATMDDDETVSSSSSASSSSHAIPDNGIGVEQLPEAELPNSQSIPTWTTERAAKYVEDIINLTRLINDNPANDIPTDSFLKELMPALFCFMQEFTEHQHHFDKKEYQAIKKALNNGRLVLYLKLNNNKSLNLAKLLNDKYPYAIFDSNIYFAVESIKKGSPNIQQIQRIYNTLTSDVRYKSGRNLFWDEGLEIIRNFLQQQSEQ